MEIVLKKEVAQRIGFEKFETFGIEPDAWRSWKESHEIDLAKMPMKVMDDFEALLNRYKNEKGVPVLLHDIQVWRKVLASGADDKRARTVRQFEPLLAQYLLHVPGHRVYKRHTDGAMLCYYVVEIKFHPPVISSSGNQPPYVTIHLAYDEIGGRTSTSTAFYSGDCIGVPVAKALLDKGFIIEDDELRADYLLQHERYLDVAQSVGKQFWGRGYAYGTGDRYSEWSKPTELDRYGEPARVVIDVFNEEGKGESSKGSVNLNPFYWPNIAAGSHYDPETDKYTGPVDEDTSLERPDIEVPTHPWLIVYHLSKHLRLRAHVGQLEEYVYDEQLSEKLVLPEDQKNLVKLLIDTKGGAFQDIVQGKGSGAVVLLTGEPGVGKTLTAEVYAESEKRALYSVQCSQLGTTPEHLEAALLKVFDRARRWNAVMLLDEADVYVHERGDSMQQNAIVGVFLRVLEYQGSTLFLTSNRPDDVDDAIASRCIARLHYSAPGIADAQRIWRILSDTAGVKMDSKVIHDVVLANPGMTGRDIKNILKLASLLKGGDSVTFEDVEYVKQFKPTGKIMDRSV